VITHENRFMPMHLLTCDIERAGRDAGPYYVWWRRASVPAVFRCMKAISNLGAGAYISL